MRMNKGAILLSMAIIALASVLVGAGTMAYFNEIVQATGNTFTAGNLDIKLSTTSSGPWVSGPIAGFWDSPVGWAPGETFTRRLYFKNFGNVDVQVVILDFKNYVSDVAGFWNVIEVESFYENVVGMGTNYAPIIAGWDLHPSQYSDHAVPFTLHELIVMVPNGISGRMNDADLILFDLFKGPCTDPSCTATSKSLMGGTYLAPNAVGWLQLGFKFSSTAGSAYEGATCSFDLQMSFIQGPDSGVCRHELPGFVP